MVKNYSFEWLVSKNNGDIARKAMVAVMHSACLQEFLKNKSVYGRIDEKIIGDASARCCRCFQR